MECRQGAFLEELVDGAKAIKQVCRGMNGNDSKFHKQFVHPEIVFVLLFLGQDDQEVKERGVSGVCGTCVGG